MLTLSHIDKIKVKLSEISSLDELEQSDKQLFDLIEKHYTLFVGADVSKDKFAINVKKYNCETIYQGEFSNHHAGFCQLIDTFNCLNESTQFKFVVAIESTGPYHKLDFLVDDKVVLELKVVEAIADVHVSQVISYLAASKKKVGLILNFAAERLVDGIKRIVL